MTDQSVTYPTALPSAESSERKRTLLLQADVAGILSALVALSVLLAPIRFGFLDAIRPTTVILPPCALYLLATHWKIVKSFLNTRIGVAFLGLLTLMVVGHLLGNDFIEGYQSGDYSVLALESLAGIPLVFLSGVLLGQCHERYPMLSIALGLGLAVHVVSIAVMPPVVAYREYDRMAGLLMDPNILLLHVIPIYFLWQSFLVGRLGLICGLLGVPLVVWATLQTLSRAGLVALLAGFAMQFLSALIGARRLRDRLWVILAAFALGGLLFIVSLSRPDFFQNRFSGYSTRNLERVNEAGSLLGDRMLWLNELANHSLEDHLFNPLGMGYGEFQRDNALLPHNTFIDIYIIGGPAAIILYMLLFGALLVALLRSLFRRSPHPQIRIRAVALLACLVTEAMMLSSLSVLSWKINWLVLGLLVGAVFTFRPRAQ